jgi:hypothetical protein
MGDGTEPLAIVIYINDSFVKNKTAVIPIYITMRDLDSAVSGTSMVWTVKCLARSAQSQVASRIYETRDGLHPTRTSYHDAQMKHAHSGILVVSMPYPVLISCLYLSQVRLGD